MTVEGLRILLVAPTSPGADPLAAIARIGFAAAEGPIPLAEAPARLVSVDAVLHLGAADPGALAALLAAGRNRSPEVPVVVAADLPVATEAALVEAGVEAVAPADRIARLVPIIRRAVTRARATADLPRVEAQLAAAQERLNGLIERVSGILYEVDPTTGDFVQVSRQAESILGFPTASWLEPGFWSRHCHPADQAGVDALWRREAATGRPYTLEYRMIAADGRVVWFQDWGALIRTPNREPRITGLMVDVSRLKEIEETSRLLTQLTARHTGEEFFRTLVLALTRALGIRFALVGEIRGVERDRIETVVAASDGELVDPFSYPLVASPCGIVASGIPHFVATGARTQYPDCPTIQRFGADSYFGLPLFGADGRPIGVLVVMDDTSFERTDPFETVLSLSASRAGAELERRRTEAERGTLHAQLVQAQKMEAIGTLAGGIAHDFNNILMGILGNAEMAKDELPSWNPVHGYLGEILRATHRARDVVQRILTFGRKREPHRQPVSLSQIVGAAAILLRATLPATIDLQLDLLAVAPSIDADPGQIHQVVMNLVTNAAHAIGTVPGTIALRESLVDVDADLARAHVRLEARRYLRLSVSDTGAGMDPATLERIFEPFFTTKAPGKGTGLGLAVVHGILEEHDGAVVVESEPGRGTVFHLYFPAIAQAAPASGSAAGAIPRGQGEHILLVDDEPAIVQVARQMLERLGYRVTGVGDAEAALDAFAAAPESFHLVLSDLTMPHQTGYDLCQRIRLLNPGVGFVLATGHPEVLEGPPPSGVDALLSKPFATARLAHVLDRVLRPRVSP